MAKKNQSNRLAEQHKENQGAIGIFGNEAKSHDDLVGVTSRQAKSRLEREYPQLTFRYRASVDKKEINASLQQIDSNLGQTLFVADASIKPDGGLIEVQDDNGNWRIVLVSEAKHQGKDIENIKQGILVGKTTTKI